MKGTSNTICQTFESSETYTALGKMTAKECKPRSKKLKGMKTYKSSCYTQFMVLAYRTILQNLREPLIVKTRVYQNIFVAIVLGAIYYNQKLTQSGIMNINGALFIFLTNLTFANNFLVVNTFCADMPIFLREYASGLYSVKSYYIAKMVAQFPMFVLNLMVFVSIFYWMVGFTSGNANFALFMLVGFLVLMAVLGFGYMSGSLAPDLPMAMAISPIILTPLVLYGGLFINQETMPVWLIWIKYLSWFFYGMEVLMVNQWEEANKLECPPDTSTRCFLTGSEILDFYGFTPNHNFRNMLALTALSIGFRFVGFIFLSLRARRESRWGGQICSVKLRN